MPVCVRPEASMLQIVKIGGMSMLLSVSGNVFMFGMVKAYLSYVGLGGAANVVDWIFGVVVTSM